ncbi:Gfo/Idh/MocA family oxidoreductase [candidate division KSB1 bacterium]|nr:Gfo/Idh/MocA family oxidoreductase [candidate division KSB1 bacterium]
MLKIKWGIISTARIGIKAVIPAMQKSSYCDIVAIASRDFDRAKQLGTMLNIPKSYGSYDELLADPEIDAIYNPLPNHLHVPYSIKALEAGKHVLCEKPIAVNVQDALKLLSVSQKYPHLRVMEAFMYRFHPQWDYVKDMIAKNTIGGITAIHSIFSYCNTDELNIRNVPEYGGGGLLDIGCYCISQSRYLLNNEPVRVFGKIDRDPKYGVDRLTNAMLDFGDETALFTCGTQMVNAQGVHIYGTHGRIDVKDPFTPNAELPAKISITNEKSRSMVEIMPANQYTRQGDLFSISILENKPLPFTLDDAINNMKTIDAIFKSSEEKGWVNIT